MSKLKKREIVMRKMGEKEDEGEKVGLTDLVKSGKRNYRWSYLFWSRRRSWGPLPAPQWLRREPPEPTRKTSVYPSNKVRGLRKDNRRDVRYKNKNDTKSRDLTSREKFSTDSPLRTQTHRKENWTSLLNPHPFLPHLSQVSFFTERFCRRDSHKIETLTTETK